MPEPDVLESGHPGRTLGKRLGVFAGLLAGFLLLAGINLWRCSRSAMRSDSGGTISLRHGLAADEKLTAYIDATDLASAVRMYGELTGRTLLPQTNSPLERLDDFAGRRLSRWHLVKRSPQPGSGIQYHRDGRLSAGEAKEELETLFRAAGLRPVPVGRRYFRVINGTSFPTSTPETRSR